MLRWVLILGCLGTACGVPEHGPWMYPGMDCKSCHSAGNEASSKPWSAGGTVYDSAGQTVEGAQILIKDARGKAVTLTSNGGGNFYTGEALAEPYQEVALLYKGKQQNMPMTAATPATGSCNSCHTAGGQAGTGVRIPSP